MRIYWLSFCLLTVCLGLMPPGHLFADAGAVESEAVFIGDAGADGLGEKGLVTSEEDMCGGDCAPIGLPDPSDFDPWGASCSFRGNWFDVDADAIVTEFGFFLDLPESLDITLYFSCFEKLESGRDYGYFERCSALPDDIRIVVPYDPENPDPDWAFYSTCPIDPPIPLEAGKSYVFGVAWGNATLAYARDDSFDPPRRFPGFPNGIWHGSVSVSLRCPPEPPLIVPEDAQYMWGSNSYGPWIMEICLAGACCTGGTCQDLSEGECQEEPGSFTCPGLTCGALDAQHLGCPLAEAACCVEVAECVFECIETDEFSCVGCDGQGGVGGTWDSDAACRQDPLLNPCLCRGACCLTDENDNGVCVDGITEQGCLDAHGFYRGRATTCDRVEPRCTVGACCVAGEECLIRTKDECKAPTLNGLFLGYGVGCEPNPCIPTGACCVGNACDELTEDECWSEGGNYRGDGTTCDHPPVVCGRGACCREDRGCSDANGLGVSEITCRNIIVGVFQGDGTSCVTLDPPCPGVCCSGSQCFENVDPVTCTEELVGEFAGYGACDPTPCPVSGAAACCLPTGACTEATQQICENVLPGEFIAGKTCSSVTCVVPPRTGACCLVDRFEGACCVGDACTMETEENCISLGGDYVGVGIACDSILDSDPPSCVIDARQPQDPHDPETRFGWQSVTLALPCSTAGMVPDDFTVTVESGTAPIITNVTLEDNTATLELSEPMPAGQWTCFGLTADPGEEVCLGYLPGDVDGDRTAATADIPGLIDCLNGVASCALRQCDIDRAGECGPADILRVIDLLNGAAGFEPWLGESIGLISECPLGACRMLDASWVDNLPGGQCEMDHGIWASGSSCTDVIPYATEGECDDTLTEAECLAVPGQLYQGDGVKCAQVDCTRGACCLVDGDCVDTVESECTELGGDFDDQHECATANCPVGGACCLPDETCETYTLAACESLFGSHQGDGSECNDPGIICERGACCLPDDLVGAVCGFLTEADCTDQGGVYRDDETECVPYACMSGVCCFDDGSCIHPTDGLACALAEGHFSPLADDCAVCPPASACCLTNGTCANLTREACDAAEGSRVGDDVLCESVAGACDLGACCRLDGTCLDHEDGPDHRFRFQCEDEQDEFYPHNIFYPSEDCDDLEPPCQARGACCPDNPDDPCEVLKFEDCHESGTYRGDAVLCLPDAETACKLGACCFDDGACDDGDGIDCLVFWEGDRFLLDEQCPVDPDDPNPCPQAAACCFEGESCLKLTEEACSAYNGLLWVSHVPECGDYTCQRSVCCYLNATCVEDMPGFQCDDVEGLFLPNIPTCSPDLCPLRGACCPPDEVCITPTEQECLDLGGNYVGHAVPCGDPNTGGINCQEGACCDLFGDWHDDWSRADCEAVYGDYYAGSNSWDVEPDEPCVPRGACCLPDETCALLAEQECDGAEGVYVGDGVRCEAVGEEGCLSGVCCELDGTCVGDILGFQCDAAEELFLAGVSSCSPNPCPVRGACCITDLSCVDYSSEDDCEAADGVWFSGSLCSGIEEGCPIGACCLPDETCVIRKALECEDADHAYVGNGEACEGIDCSVGACCLLDGTCTDDQRGFQCDAVYGDLYSDLLTCQDNCDARGACCVSGVCTIERPEDCAGQEDNYIGTGIPCEPDPCLAVVSSDPPNCAVDARQPHALNDAADEFGWESLKITFDRDPLALDDPFDFKVEQIPAESPPPPAITDVDNTVGGNAVKLQLSEPINPENWTCFALVWNEDQQVCLGYLPGDVDGSGTVAAADIPKIIDCLNGAASCEIRQCDADRDGECGPADILRVIDLLNGGADFEPWLGEFIGSDEPSPCPSG